MSLASTTEEIQATITGQVLWANPPTAGSMTFDTNGFSVVLEGDGDANTILVTPTEEMDGRGKLYVELEYEVLGDFFPRPYFNIVDTSVSPPTQTATLFVAINTNPGAVQITSTFTGELEFWTNEFTAFTDGDVMGMAVEETPNGDNFDVSVRLYKNGVELPNSPYVTATTSSRAQVMGYFPYNGFSGSDPTTFNFRMGNNGEYIYDIPDGYAPYGPYEAA